MERPLCYDVTRMLTRVLNATASPTAWRRIFSDHPTGRVPA